MPRKKPAPKVEDVNPKTIAGSTKPTLEYVPTAILYRLGGVMQYGAVTKDYGKFNWREKAVPASTYIRAIRSHLDLYEAKQDLDESGFEHIEMIMGSCVVLLDAKAHGKLVDDRIHDKTLIALLSQPSVAIAAPASKGSAAKPTLPLATPPGPSKAKSTPAAAPKAPAKAPAAAKPAPAPKEPKLSLADKAMAAKKAAPAKPVAAKPTPAPKEPKLSLGDKIRAKAEPKKAPPKADPAVMPIGGADQDLSI